MLRRWHRERRFLTSMINNCTAYRSRVEQNRVTCFVRQMYYPVLQYKYIFNFMTGNETRKKKKKKKKKTTPRFIPDMHIQVSIIELSYQMSVLTLSDCIGYICSCLYETFNQKLKIGKSANPLHTHHTELDVRSNVRFFPFACKKYVTYAYKNVRVLNSNEFFFCSVAKFCIFCTFCSSCPSYLK